MAQDIAAIQHPIFQRLAIPFDQDPQSHQDGTTNIVPDSIESLSNNIIDGFHLIAVWYRSAGSSALKDLVDNSTLTQEEVDRISARYETSLRKVQGYVAKLVQMRQKVTPALLSPLVDEAAKFKEAWSIVEQGHKLVDTLNSPGRIQRLRDLTPDRKNKIIAVCEYRRQSFQDSLQSAHEAASFWAHHHESLETRRNFVMDRITKWEGAKQKVEAQLQELQRGLPESLHEDLDSDRLPMAAGTRLEGEITAIFEGLHNAAAAAEEAEAEDEVKTEDEAMEDVENEEEWDELSLVEEDGPKSEEWSQEELDTLKGRLGNPFPVLIIAGEMKFEERSLYERQFLKENDDGKVGLNDCVICGDPLNDACLLSTCDHVFCIKCIAQALDAKKECPACRRSAQHDDLTPLEVTIVEEGGQMDVDG